MLDHPRICCLDLDTFFVSVERVLDPSLEGKPVIVGGRPGQRGVVTACSYEVRFRGVRSGMSLTEAARRAPRAVYLPTRGSLYGEYAEKVRNIAGRYTPVMQVASIDELFLDFSGCERLYRLHSGEAGDATIERVVGELTASIRDELGLPSSAGIATSRTLAKVASGQAKPAGVLLVKAGCEAAFLRPLPLRALPGIGPVAEARLSALGLATLGQLAQTPLASLRAALGSWAEALRAASRGRASSDISRDRPAFREHDVAGDAAGSLSNERTFREDLEDPAAIQSRLCSLCEKVCFRARKRGVRARTVTLKLRYHDFQTLTRSRTIPSTSADSELLPVLLELFRRARRRRAPVRLLGVALSNLVLDDRQLRLFGDDSRRWEAVDTVRARYGYDAIGLAGSLRVRHSRPKPRPGAFVRGSIESPV